MDRLKFGGMGCLAQALGMVVLVAGVWTGSAALLAAPAPPQAGLPTPESVLGFKPGADYHLATYEQSIAYFKQLAAATDRLQLVEIGRTSEGKPWYMAVVSSAANLANLDHYRDIARRLAHPKGLTDAEARQLAQEGKAIVHIDGGLHASEVAPAQHTIQLAYDLVSGADHDPRVRRILDNVIVMLWPSVNPDGQDIVANWYASNLGTPYEVAPLVQLYQKYVGHDNNRDGYMLNMIESRVIERTWRAWEPQIIYVHHQTAPFPTRIWLPPFADPIGSDAPPLMSREVNSIGMLIAQALEERGQAGATHMGTGFDAWYPGYIDYMPMYKNIVSFWTETALYRYATPHYYTLSDFPRDMQDLRPESLYSSPWRGGWWRLGDAVSYMLTASTAVLDYAARYKDELLYNRYQAGRDTIREFQDGPPYAYVIPQDQRDPVAPVELLRRLAYSGIRVSALSAPAEIDGEKYPAGTWVVPMDQEYAQLAKEVLEVQHYPDLREYPEGPPEQPYDAAGWTLPYQMQVQVIASMAPLDEAARAALKPVEGQALDWRTAGDADAAPFDSVPGPGFNTDAVAAGIVPLVPKVGGSGPVLVVDGGQNNAYRAVNAAWKAGGAVRVDARGRYEISGVADGTLNQWVQSLALRADRAASASGVRLQKPRIGLFRPWTASMDEGWTRWLLEQYGFDFTSLYDADVRAGGLGARYDVIIIADERPRTILDGYREGTVPPRYAGGVGEAGTRALDEFVRGGGTLVCFNNSTAFAIDAFHLPVKNVVAGLPRNQFFANGSLLQVIPDTSYPITAGMPDRAAVFVDRSPVFTTLDGFEGAVLMKYPGGSPLMSGYLLGESHVAGYAAAVDARYGDGHVVLLGFRPQWRGQSFGTFKVIFAAALFHGDVAAKATGAKGFWTAPVESGESPARSGKPPADR